MFSFQHTLTPKHSHLYRAFLILKIKGSFFFFFSTTSLVCSLSLCVDSGWPDTQKEEKNDRVRGDTRRRESADAQ